jgi:hypothetical protein
MTAEILKEKIKKRENLSALNYNELKTDNMKKLATEFCKDKIDGKIKNEDIVSEWRQRLEKYLNKL